MPSTDLVFRFLGVDNGAGREFDRMASKADHTTAAVKRFALGVAAAGVTVVGASIVMADKFELAHAKLQQAFKNTGADADRYRRQIAAANKQMEIYGFTNTQTEEALANLATALHSPAKAFRDIGLAADLARFKHISLADAATAVARGEQGNLRALKQLGVDLPFASGGAAKLAVAKGNLAKATVAYTQLLDRQHAKDKLSLADQQALQNAQDRIANAKTGTQLAAAQTAYAQLLDRVHGKQQMSLADQQALQNAQTRLRDAQQKVNESAREGTTIHAALAHVLGGQAAAAAQTASGKYAAMKARIQDMGTQIGEQLLPDLEALVSFVNKDVIPALDQFGGWAKRNKGWLEPLAKTLAGIALAYKALGAAAKVSQGIKGVITHLPGVGSGVLAKATERGSTPVNPLYVWVVDQKNGGSGFSGTAIKDTEKAAATGAAAVAANSLRKRAAAAVADAIETVKALRGPLGIAYLATQGGDVAPGTGAIYSSGPGDYRSKNAQGAQLLAGILTPQQLQMRGLIKNNGAVHELQEARAVQRIMADGNQKQIAALNVLAKVYPVIGRAVDVYRQASDRAADSIGAEKHQLAELSAEVARHLQHVAATEAAVKKIPGAWAQLAAEAKAAGITIGEALDSGVAVGIAEMRAQAVAEAQKLGVVTWQATAKALELGDGDPSHGAPPKATTIGKTIGKAVAAGVTSAVSSGVSAVGSATDAMLTKVTTQVDNAIGKLNADLAAKVQEQQSIKSQLAGAANISGATVLGGDGPRGGVKGFLSSEASQLRQLALIIGKLRKKGLSPILLAQIANAGPQQGLLIAQSILAGSEGSIGGLNRLETSIQTYSGTTARTVATAEYQKVLSKDAAALQKVADEVQRLASKGWREADMHRLSELIAAAIKKAPPQLNLNQLDHALGAQIRGG